MTMRCTILRDVSVAKDGYGQPQPVWQIIADGVPCFVWEGGGGRETVYGDQRTVTTKVPGAILPLGTDVKALDRVSSVRNRLGKDLFSGFTVDSVYPRRDHIGARLVHHGG